MREVSRVRSARFHAAVFLDGPFLSPSPLSLLAPSLPPYLYRRRTPTRPRSPPSLCSAWLLDLLHLATQRLCPSPLPSRPSCAVRSHPSVFPLVRPCLGRLPGPCLSPFFPAVGLGIKIRHFIVSKFCEADNIAAPIAAAPPGESGNPSVLVLLPHK